MREMTGPRFSIRCIHLNRGWRYMVLDRALWSGFLADKDGADLDFGTVDEARAAILAQHGADYAMAAVVKGEAR